MEAINTINSMLDTIASSLTVWTTTRAAAFTSYLLLFAAMTAGLLQGGTWATGARKAKLNMIHQWSGWFGILFGMLHGLVLTFGTDVPYDLKGILVPFASDYEPVWSGLGTLALYGMILLVATSDLMKKLGKKVWRAIHFLAAPTYVMALLHGIMEGSDTSRMAFTIMYALTGAIVLGLIIYRIWYAARSSQNKVKRQPARSV
ncbi:ferric reductase-like transmembrane domain-containing protein [Paenibacillus pinistramenti]|uniref:ferric reductase-like transmembrane domain-containing protein n=1 Tax=Paenibacillus pinistramenti TaxID=1768003 RepID=UPI001396BFB9|nr:ferric reductase-like transmembrane domain-containing protein [Paenibacillus pinistramenti]